MSEDINFIAKTNFRKKNQTFGIKRADRRQHLYVVGKTGVGKTAFLKNMALQDIQNGEGLAIIDPHGEFVEEILDNIPPHRVNDVVYFNPADMDHPVSFNIMEVADPKYKHLIASGLIGIFTKIWANVWSARMEYILANCILALLDTPGTTLLGIPRILVDRDYRQQIINNLKDPVVKSFWINEYEEWDPRYRNEAIAPVQNKVGQFLNVSFVRNIVGQAKNTIDIEEIMNSQKILLVNVSKGRIGEDNSAILGAMIITKIQLAAMERVRIPEEDRKDFYLYVDEFQNFATDSFVNILSEARKYRLDLIIAHQYVGQLVTETTTAVRDAVFGNVGTLVVFRVGAGDAEFLEQEFSPEFMQDDLIRLPNYNIYIKLLIDGITSRPFSAQTITPHPIDRKITTHKEIINISRQKYARNRIDVEEEITRWAGNLETPSPSLASFNSQPRMSNSSSQSQVKLYDAKCSNCGKSTKVTFLPEPGKPVYCKSCLKKIKRDKTPQKLAGPLREAKSGDISALGDLGIEFGSSKSPRRESPRSSAFSTQKSSSKQVSQLKEKVKPISLSEITKKEPVTFSKKKKEVNLDDLKKSLTEALSKETKEQKNERTEEQKNEKTNEQKNDKPKEKELENNQSKSNNQNPTPSPNTQNQTPKTQDQNKKGIINPGDKIRFE